jgi:hypothetical protein
VVQREPLYGSKLDKKRCHVSTLGVELVGFLAIQRSFVGRDAQRKPRKNDPEAWKTYPEYRGRPKRP